MATRADMVTLLYRYAQRTNRRQVNASSLEAFSDAAAVPSYAQEAVRWAVGSGMLKGDETGRLNPRANLTRAQAAALFRRYLEQ